MNNAKQNDKCMPHRLALACVCVCAAWLAAGCGTPQLAPPVQMEPAPAATHEMPPDRQPEVVALRAVLSGDGAGRGELVAVFNRETNLLRWKLRFGNLASPVTSAGFYARGADGSDVNVLPAGRKVVSPHEGRAVLTQSQRDGLLAGQWQFRLNTRQAPQGALAGALVQAH